jgi:hypothetical protein
LNGQTPAARPWYTVAIQRASGSGRRWLSEIETSGMSSNSL